MKKYTYLTILLFFFLVSCRQSDNHSKIILQTIGFSDSTLIYLDNSITRNTDTGYIIDNNLVFSAETDEPTRFTIRPIYKRGVDYDMKSFWKEDKKVTIKALTGKLKTAIVEGSEIQKQLDIINASKAPLKRLNDSLLAEYRKLSREETEKRLELRTQGKKIAKAISDVEVDYIKNNSNELYSVITLKNLMSYTISKTQTKELFENLSDKLKSTKYGLNIQKYLDLSTDFKIGDKAKDFQLPDLEGNLFGLSSFKGKYILLDFWSANCGPCIMEIPVLLENYKKYRDKGFEILSVSLDKKREDWENMVKNKGMIWITVGDLEGLDGDIPMTYSVYYMPTYYLINPDGIIIDKILGRGQLDEKIKKLFND